MNWIGRMFRRQESHEKWAKRVAAGIAADVQIRGLSIAETPSYTASWMGAAGSLNHDLRAGLTTARKRARDLTRNNDYGRKFLLHMRANVLGPAGIVLQMRATGENGEQDKSTNAAVESAWYAWGRRGQCDVSGRYTWQDIERLCLDSLCRDGEFLLRLVRGRGPHGLLVQLLDVALLDVDLHRDGPAGRVRLGVEVDAENRPVAYWVRGAQRVGDLWADDYSVGQHVRIPADEIIHGFVAEEPDQLRGLPWLVAGGRRLWMLRDYEESVAVASANAAKRLGFFVSANGEEPPGFADRIESALLAAREAAGRELSVAEIEQIKTAAVKYATVVPGQFDTLPLGYDFKPFESEQPQANYGEYTKECVRGYAAGVGLSYVTVGNNLEAVNFSSARVGINDEREHLKSLQQWFVDHMHGEVIAAYLRHALLRAPQLQGIAYARLPQLLESATWQPRRWDGIDQVKEADANRINLDLGVTSRRRVILKGGEDPDEIFDELEAENARFGAPAAEKPGQYDPPPADGEDTPPAPRNLRVIQGDWSWAI